MPELQCFSDAASVYDVAVSGQYVDFYSNTGVACLLMLLDS